MRNRNQCAAFLFVLLTAGLSPPRLAAQISPQHPGNATNESAPAKPADNPFAHPGDDPFAGPATGPFGRAPRVRVRSDKDDPFGDADDPFGGAGPAPVGGDDDPFGSSGPAPASDADDPFGSGGPAKPPLDDNLKLRLLIDRQTIVAGKPFTLAEVIEGNRKGDPVLVRTIFHRFEKRKISKSKVRRTNTEEITKKIIEQDVVWTIDDMEVSGGSSGTGFHPPRRCQAHCSQVSISRPGLYEFKSEWYVEVDGRRRRVPAQPLKIRVKAQPGNDEGPTDAPR